MHYNAPPHSDEKARIEAHLLIKPEHGIPPNPLPALPRVTDLSQTVFAELGEKLLLWKFMLIYCQGIHEN